MGEGSPDTRSLAVAQCIADIEVADFIALDLEFSGLFLSVERERRQLTLDQYFTKCVESIPQFLPLQLGVCCAQQRPARGLWELRVHEFNLWPQDRRIFTADLQSLRFLRGHGFDFNTFFEQAHPYTRLPALDDASSVVKRTMPYATQILAALRKARVPLVFHNGLLDLLHLFDKFVGDLPDNIGEFGEEWVENFPLLFDTRLLAQEGRFQVLKHSGGLSLEELHRHLSGLPSTTVRFERGGPLGGAGSAHGSSGFDALLTAEVFLMEMDLWIRSEPSSGARKRRRKEDAEPADRIPAGPGGARASGAEAEGAAAGGTPGEEDDGGWTVVGRKRPLPQEAAAAEEASAGGLSSPSLLESHRICRRFHNKLAIVGASPGCLALKRPPELPIPRGSPLEQAGGEGLPAGVPAEAPATALFIPV